MAKSNKGFLSFLIGPIANDGGMGTVLTAIGSTVKGSFKYATTDAVKKDFFIEESTAPFDSSTTTVPNLEGSFEVYDMDPDTIVKLYQGTVASVGTGANKTKTFTPATNYQSIEVSAKVTSLNGNILSMVRLQFDTTFNFDFNDDELSKMTIKAKTLAPNKVNTAPWVFSVPDPA